MLWVLKRIVSTINAIFNMFKVGKPVIILVLCTLPPDAFLYICVVMFNQVYYRCFLYICVVMFNQVYYRNILVEINTLYESKIVYIFLSISFNICFGC